MQRIFSTLLILLAIGCAALWIIGGAKTENETSLEFDATPEQIFPHLTEPNRIRQWFSGLVSIDPILAPSDSPDSPPPPAIRRVLQNADGGQSNYEDQLLRYTTDRILALKSRGDSKTITWVYQLEPKSDGKTNVIFRVIKSASGLSRLLAPLQTNISIKQIEVDIRQLKEVVESSTDFSSDRSDLGDESEEDSSAFAPTGG